jgi:hypothetical protein
MMYAQTNEVLEQIREGLMRVFNETEASNPTSKAGEGGADNVQDANAAVDRYVADMVDQLMIELGMSDDDAFDFVFSHLHKGSEDGQLAPLPDADADPEELASWLGKATTLGVSAAIVRAARSK